jgi:dipeptidyl aminopeptidase/acylaminoacyl peptidase
MAEVATTRIAARDGLGLPLWLTLPDVRRPAPAVVLVHGGPWVRDGHWEWDAWAQFLASRGVVVLAPEFRGSAGYGQRHLQAGWRQWGRAMQDDLADTVDWAVKQGLVDPTRVCIVGASYGGYAALMGLVRQPDLFRCAVSWVPVVDLNTLLREGSPDDWDDEVRAFSLPQMVGDWQQDAAALAEVSPLAQVDRIRQPLLLAWGEKDRRADPGPTRRLARALQEAGRPVEAVEYAGEGHHWLKQATRLDFARRVDAFLARHLQLATGAP